MLKRKNKIIVPAIILILMNFAQGFVAFAEDPVEAPAPAQVEAPTPAPVEAPTPVQAETPIPASSEISSPSQVQAETPAKTEEQLQDKSLDEIFSNPIVEEVTTDEAPIAEQQDFDQIFSDVISEDINQIKDEETPKIQEESVDGITKEDIEKFNDTFSGEGVESTKPVTEKEIDMSQIKKPIDESIEKQPPEEEENNQHITPLQSCAFNEFSVEINGNDTKSIPIILKKSNSNKQFGLKVGKLPEGIDIKFDSSNKSFVSGSSGSANIASKYNDLENDILNKKIIVEESVLKEVEKKTKGKEQDNSPNINHREIIVEEMTIKSEAEVQKGSFNIQIIYGESNDTITEANFPSNKIIRTNCQFNLVIK